jgi:hypothetical protein
MAPKLHEACFLEKIKTVFKSFKKFEKKILDIDNN